MAKVALDLRADAALPAAPRYADFVEFSRDTIEALSSNAALSAGLEAIGEELAHHVCASCASAGETARGLLAARTLEHVVRLQTDFAGRSVARFVARSTKLSEIGCALLGTSMGAWIACAKN